MDKNLFQSLLSQAHEELINSDQFIEEGQNNKA